VAAALAACWPHVAVEGAPCPCPNGFACCDTLATCLPAGEACPSAYPASSRQPCRFDAGCPLAEICAAWSLDDGVIMGPQECRRACPDDYPCADGESCGLVAHDAVLLDALHVTRACLATPPTVDCAGASCAACLATDLGRSFCDGTHVLGCFLALSPSCGVSCDVLDLEDCVDEVCEDEAAGAACRGNGVPNGDPCGEHPCAACPAGAAPGEVVCVGDEVVRCLAVPVVDQSCSEACEVTTTPCSQGYHCVADGGAHCAL